MSMTISIEKFTIDMLELAMADKQNEDVALSTEASAGHLSGA